MYCPPSRETFSPHSSVRQVFLIVTAFTSRPTYVLRSSRPFVLHSMVFSFPPYNLSSA